MREQSPSAIKLLPLQHPALSAVLQMGAAFVVLVANLCQGVAQPLTAQHTVEEETLLCLGAANAQHLQRVVVVLRDVAE